MIKFLQDVPPGAVAVGTVVIIALAFILKPGKAKPKFAPTDQWTAGEYFMYLKSLIVTSRNFAQLDQVRPEVDKFLAKYCNTHQDNKELQKYYSRLMNSIIDKERELLKSIAKAV